jgi:hypothetical protein
MFVLFAVIYPIVGVGEDLPEPPGDPGQGAMILLVCCFIQATILSMLIWRSKWSGLRLVLTMAVVWVLGGAVLSQMDTMWFMPETGLEFIGKIVIATGLQAILFSVIAVWLLGKWRSDHPEETLNIDTPAWVKAFLVLAILHIVLYFTCGYFIAWQSEELRAFYEGEDPGSFFAQMASLLEGDPWLFAFQFLRGLIWALVAALLFAMLAGSRISTSLISAGVVVALFSLMLALPNPLMPEAVRYTHLVETIVSRGLFAFTAVWYLHSLQRPRESGLA